MSNEENVSHFHNYCVSLIATGQALPESIIGCTADEIAALEQEFGVTLPEPYRAFLHIMGQGMGALLEYSTIYSQVRIANQSLRRDWKLNLVEPPAKEMFAFFWHDGYEWDMFDIEDPKLLVCRYYGNRYLEIELGYSTPFEQSNISFLEYMSENEEFELNENRLKRQINTLYSDLKRLQSMNFSQDRFWGKDYLDDSEWSKQIRAGIRENFRDQELGMLREDTQ